MNLKENVPLGPYTTLGIGGPARYFTEAANERDIRDVIDFVQSKQVPLFVLGGGSNLVVSDSGFSGLVMKVAVRGIDESAAQDKRLFQVGAGEDWDTFVAHTVAENCAGLECLSGIPGTVGATPVQNVGAYGQEVADTIVTLHALDLTNGLIRELRPNSADSLIAPASLTPTNVDVSSFSAYVSHCSPMARLRSKILSDLKNHFAGHNAPSLSEVRDAVREIRRSKAMLIVEGDQDCGGARRILL